jgi:hypothetical protein
MSQSAWMLLGGRDDAADVMSSDFNSRCWIYDTGPFTFFH